MSMMFAVSLVLTSCCKLYADDLKLFSVIEPSDDGRLLQNDLANLKAYVTATGFS